MDQATQPTTPTPSAERFAYKQALALATRIVDRLPIVPRSVEMMREVGGMAYGVRLHVGTGLPAGRAVLTVAEIADAEVTLDRAASDAGEWVECRTTVGGVPLIARALLTLEDAEELLQKTPTGPDVVLPRGVRLDRVVAQVGGAR